MVLRPWTVLLVVGLAAGVDGCADNPITGRRTSRSCLEAPPEDGPSRYPDLASTLDADVSMEAIRERRWFLSTSDELLDLATGMALARSAVRWFAELERMEAESGRCADDTPAGRARAELLAALDATIQALELRVEDPAPLDYVRAHAMTNDPWPTSCDAVARDERLEAVMWRVYGPQRDTGRRVYVDGPLVCQRFQTRGWSFEILRDPPTQGRRVPTLEAWVEDRTPQGCEAAVDVDVDPSSLATWGAPDPAHDRCALDRVRLPYDAVAVVATAFFCGSLCGDGQEHVLVRVRGRWRYVDGYVTWMS